MNKQRRKEIAVLIEQAKELKGKFEDIRDEEQDYFDNMPENMQTGERGERSENALNALNSICDNLDSDIDSIESDCEL